MALEINSLQRVFVYKGKELQDIPGLSLKDVCKSYSDIYPELVNSSPEFDKVENGKEYYTFNNKVGTKG